MDKLNINSEASQYSFIHESFVRENDFPIREANHSFQVVAPGIMHETKWVVSKAKLEVARLEFRVDLLMLKLGDLDAILGMNWMYQHLSM